MDERRRYEDNANGDWDGGGGQWMRRRVDESGSSFVYADDDAGIF